jgi:predicted RNA-binding protein (virulence factor B family)
LPKNTNTLIHIGQYATLDVVKEVDFGVYLDGGPFGEILLPAKYVPAGTAPGDELKVFIYSDSEDRLIATRDEPKATVGNFASMEVRQVNEYGAFLDWGISGKDLMVPFREQRERMEVGKHYLVYVYLDEKTDRIVASSKLNKFLEEKGGDYEPNQEVAIIVGDATDLGYRVIIDKQYWGILYKNEIFQEINPGDQLKAFIKNIREDGRIDVSLQVQGVQSIDHGSEQVLAAIKGNNGFLPLTDKSAPDLIYQHLGMSKKAFKRAVGSLYKQRLIKLEKEGLRLS